MSAPVAQLPVTPEDLHVFGQEVLTAFLLEGGHQPSAVAPDDRPVHASIAVHGGWSGRITLDVSGAGAEDLARLMLQTEEVSSADIADTVGELVNVLGGNVKSLLTEESGLGLPQVATGVAVDPTLTEICHAELRWAGHPVHVRVWLDSQTE